MSWGVLSVFEPLRRRTSHVSVPARRYSHLYFTVISMNALEMFVIIIITSSVPVVPCVRARITFYVQALHQKCSQKHHHKGSSQVSTVFLLVDRVVTVGVSLVLEVEQRTVLAKVQAAVR